MKSWLAQVPGSLLHGLLKSPYNWVVFHPQYTAAITKVKCPYHSHVSTFKSTFQLFLTQMIQYHPCHSGLRSKSQKKTSFLSGHCMTPTQTNALLRGYPSKILTKSYKNMHCLIPPKWVPFNDPCFVEYLYLTSLILLVVWVSVTWWFLFWSTHDGGIKHPGHVSYPWYPKKSSWKDLKMITFNPMGQLCKKVNLQICLIILRNSKNGWSYPG